MITVAQLKSLSTDELCDLNKMVVSLINMRRKSATVKAVASLSVGQKVEWDSKFGHKIQGAVTKVKIKNIEVDAGPNGRWNVSATLLKAI